MTFSLRLVTSVPKFVNAALRDAESVRFMAMEAALLVMKAPETEAALGAVAPEMAALVCVEFAACLTAALVW